MFAKKKKNLTTVPEDHPVHEDLIIHNMPSASKLAGSPAAASFSAKVESASSPAAKTANFKTTGLVIIVGGFVFIGALVYFSYIYMIRPLTESPKPVLVPVSVPEASQEVLSQEEPLEELVNQETLDETNLSAEKPAAVAVAQEPEVESSEEESGSELVLAPDSDQDGLSDQDEEVFGTDPLLADTDGDGYQDAAEIRQGYNPLGEGKIDSQLIERLTNSTFGYELSYPASWPKQALSEERLLIFTAPDESLVQITAEENTDRSSIVSWYEDSFPGTKLSYDRLLSGQGWEGIRSEDGLNVYITDSSYGRILVISFISGSGRLSYPFIFELIVNSLVLK